MNTTAIHRITTREAAGLLQRKQAEALLLLKAARVAHDRAGSTYLWHAEAVARFAETLHAAAPAPSQAQG